MAEIPPPPQPVDKASPGYDNFIRGCWQTLYQLWAADNDPQNADTSTLAYVEKTAAYTMTDDDYMVNCTANTFTVTMMTSSGRTGQRFNIKNTGSGVITIDGNGSETIDGNTTIILNQWDSVTLISNGSDWLIE